MSEKGVNVPQTKKDKRESNKAPTGSRAAPCSRPDIDHGRQEGQMTDLVGIKSLGHTMGLDGEYHAWRGQKP